MQKFIISIIFTIYAVNCYSADWYTVNVDELNARRCADFKCEILWKFKNGDKISPIEITGQWAVIEVKNRIAYVNVKYLTKIEMTKVATSTKPKAVATKTTPKPVTPSATTKPVAKAAVVKPEPVKTVAVAPTPITPTVETPVQEQKKSSKKVYILVLMLISLVGATAFFFIKRKGVISGNRCPACNKNNAVEVLKKVFTGEKGGTEVAPTKQTFYDVTYQCKYCKHKYVEQEVVETDTSKK